MFLYKYEIYANVIQFKFKMFSKFNFFSIENDKEIKASINSFASSLPRPRNFRIAKLLVQTSDTSRIYRYKHFFINKKNLKTLSWLHAQ